MSFLRHAGVTLGRRRLIVAGLLLMVSLGLLAAGIVGMLLTGGKGEAKLTYEGVLNPIGTPTVPISTPPPSSAPIARIIIEKIGVDAPVVTMGVDEKGIPQVPDNPYDVAWYNWSARPGTGSNAVFAGHYDWTVNHRGVTAVFYSLKDLNVGDIIEVRLEDGTDYKYQVIGNRAIKDGDPEGMDLMAATPIEMITLITCGGVWTPDPSNPLGGNYDYRQYVRAELIGGSPPPQPEQGQIEEPRQEEDSHG